MILILLLTLHQFSQWKEKQDEFTESTIWVHQLSGETVYERPQPPSLPLVPECLLNSETSEKLNPNDILQNEADTSDDDLEEVCSVSFKSENEDVSPLPIGRDGELELAEEKVMQMKMRIMRIGNS